MDVGGREDALEARIPADAGLSARPPFHTFPYTKIILTSSCASSLVSTQRIQAKERKSWVAEERAAAAARSRVWSDASLNPDGVKLDRDIHNDIVTYNRFSASTVAPLALQTRLFLHLHLPPHLPPLHRSSPAPLRVLLHPLRCSHSLPPYKPL